jgi:hypothetical protein
MFNALKQATKHDTKENPQTLVNFCGSYMIEHDPLVSDRERVRMTVSEIWSATGYRLTCVKIYQVKF